MPSLGQAKTLGGVGAILALLFWVPANAGIVLLIIGLILMLVAVKNISEVIADPSIFSNMLYSVILAIIGPIIATVVLLAAAASFFSAFSGFTPGTTTLPANFLTIIGIVILAGVALWVCVLISTIFLRKSYDNIAMKLNVSMFKTSGLLFLIGAATLIVLVGFVILFIAAILQIVAFFSIPDQLPSAMPPGQTWGPPPAPPAMPPSQAPTQ